MTPFRFAAGSTPLLISVPHCATRIPSDIAGRMTPEGRATPDADWHVDRLYGFARALGAHMLIATYSRYVVDLNRPPDGAALYPGASNTELCPTTTFHDQPVYTAGQAPDAAETAARVEQYWRPYHDTLASVLARLTERYGIAVLLDAHSIGSRVPRFFDGQLPDLNLGTASGASCDPGLAAELARIAAASGYSWVLDGRFKGGHITRAYGRPGSGVHAVQLELSQATYMDEAPPYAVRPDAAAALEARVLRPLVEHLLEFAQRRAAA